MDPFILQPSSVPVYLDGEEICSPETASMGDSSSSEWSSSIISDTPVTVYRSEATGAPRKEGRNKSVFMFRSQIPAPRNLRGEWTLPFEGCGKWGYIFKYELGELWLYQLNEGESLMDSSSLVKLTSGDWAVLKLLIALVIREANDDFLDPEEEDVAPKRRRREVDPPPPPPPPSPSDEKEHDDPAAENDDPENDEKEYDDDDPENDEKEYDDDDPAAENDEKEHDDDPPAAENVEDEENVPPVEDDSSSDEDDHLYSITEEEDVPPAPEKEEKAAPASAAENKENIPPAPEKASEEAIPPPPPPRDGGIRFRDEELLKTKTILSTVWSSGTTDTGRWRMRASLRSTDESDAPDIFVMEKFNPDCGLFRIMMVLPAKEWIVRMLQVRKDITILFQTCRCWRDAVAVRKSLSF